MKIQALLGFLVVSILLSTPALADPPAMSGPNVIRFEGVNALAIADFDEGTQVLLGADVREFCIGNVEFDLVSIMDVFHPTQEGCSRLIRIRLTQKLAERFERNEVEPKLVVWVDEYTSKGIHEVR